MGKAQNWSLAKTLRITAFCGLGHVASSMLIGLAGIALGAQLATLVQIEGVRGSLAGYALLAFGLVYFAWGLKKAGRGRVHSHIHIHDDVVHDHAHVHAAGAKNAITPWAMFIIFVLGPCEALIPLFMYPAAQQSAGLVAAVALVFSLLTLLTMLACVAITTIGLNRFRLPTSGRYAHAVAGASVAICGALISFLGL
jgi:sulfite exporter TauE/SafE